MPDIIDLYYEGDKKTLVKVHFRARTEDINGLLLHEPEIKLSIELDGNFSPWVDIDRLQSIIEKNKQDYIDRQVELRNIMI